MMKSKRMWALLFVAAVWASMYLPRLGDIPLKGEEPRRTMPADVMLETGRWMVPSVDGLDYFSKPPAINWLVAASYVLTGVRNEFTARLPSVVFILAFVSLVVLMRSKFLSVGGRVAVALISMTTVLMATRGRLIEIEAMYVACTGMAVIWWMNVWSAKGSRWLLWLPPALFLAAGALAKGPFLGLVFYAVVVGVLLYERRLRELVSIQHIVAVAVICVICLGWVFWAKADSSGRAMTGQWSKQLGPRVIPSLKTFFFYKAAPAR